MGSIAKGLGLLGINYEEYNEPFLGASGVHHPLLSEAVTQFQAQAYKEMLPSGGPIKTQVVGAPTREIEDQAKRVKDFMNHQITEVMEEFDPDTDQMLYYLPLTGSTFKKVYFDPTKQRAVSKFVPAEDLIVPYTASDLRTAERVTHIVRMTENEVRKLQVAGVYRDVELSASDDTQKTKALSKDVLMSLLAYVQTMVTMSIHYMKSTLTWIWKGLKTLEPMAKIRALSCLILSLLMKLLAKFLAWLEALEKRIR